MGDFLDESRLHPGAAGAASWGSGSAGGGRRQRRDRLVGDDQVGAPSGCGPFQISASLAVVLLAEAVHRVVQPLLDVLAALGELVVAQLGDREELRDLDARELLQRLGVGDDVRAAAHEEERGQLADGRVAGRLVDLHLGGPGAQLQEEEQGQLNEVGLPIKISTFANSQIRKRKGVVLSVSKFTELT